ncbi:MAG: Tetratricopeptide repeat protein [Bacteroidetes bacterium]|nr:Tetratricopeptide repeat protein [Bacteroidota bacterium]
MIGQTISHYKILEKLGEGGMGVVYKAQDTKLNRPVALKFLPQHIIAKPTDKARFLQEAQAAALLNHPNICAIYAIHEDGDEQFIELEFVEGVTVRDRLPIEKTTEILDYAIQIGEALQEAHGKEIVHRDIKSENIMLNARGQVKVMDFGLAKLKGSVQLTQSSTTVGTLAYTAPEQVQGAQADPRSDIFSFGVVLYEMLTGRVPFRGEHQAALMYSILNEDPEPVEKYRPNVPPDVISIVDKALEKNPADRYQTVADMEVDLRRARRKTSGTSPAALSKMKDHDFEKAVGELGLKTATIPIKKQRKWAFLFSALGSLLLGVLIIGYLMFFKQGEPLSSLAVMPLVNVGGDPDGEYLSDGITEAVISTLSRLRNLRVMSRSSVFRYKGKEFDPLEIGKVFNVGTVLTGRIVRRENDVQLSVELVDTKDGKQIWGEQYFRAMSNIQSLQGELSKDISEQLRLQISGVESANLNTIPTSNAEAYQHYLKGRYNWNKRTPEGLERALAFYHEAIQRDSSFAQGYSGIAETHVLHPVYIFPPPIDAMEKARTFARKALELNPRLAEAYTALAYAKWSECEWPEAEKDYRKAIELNPNYATAHHWYALLLGALGDTENAFSQMRKAQEIDPLSFIIQMNLGIIFELMGRRQEAIQEYQKVIEMEPNFGLNHAALGAAYLNSGRYDEARVELEKAQSQLGTVSPFIAAYYARTGRKDQARKLLNELEQLAAKGHKVQSAIAYVYLALGDREQTLAWLKQVYTNRSVNPLYVLQIKAHPGLESMKSDPRIVEALRNAGMER